MNITAALTEAPVDVGGLPHAYKHICSHVHSRDENTVSACRLTDQAATTNMARRHAAIADRNEGNQAGRQEKHKGKEKERLLGEMGMPNLQRKRRKRGEAREWWQSPQKQRNNAARKSYTELKMNHEAETAWDAVGVP